MASRSRNPMIPVRYLVRTGEGLDKDVARQLPAQPGARIVSSDLRLQFGMKDPDLVGE